MSLTILSGDQFVVSTGDTSAISSGVNVIPEPKPAVVIASTPAAK